MPIQMNGVDCGAFMMAFIYHILCPGDVDIFLSKKIVSVGTALARGRIPVDGENTADMRRAIAEIMFEYCQTS